MLRNPYPLMLVDLKGIIAYMAHAIEFAAALIVVAAVLEATVNAGRLLFTPSAPPQRKNEVRLNLGRWPAVALEFELAADILNTAVTPAWTEIAKLVAIATLRTALKYFLQRDIDQESKLPMRGIAER
jgi:uncharacterized membrane protein